MRVTAWSGATGRRFALLLMIAGSPAGCDSGSEAAQEGTGRVLVSVADASGVAISGIVVGITLPWSGGTYTVSSSTGADGTWGFAGIREGLWPVTATPGASFAPTADSLTKRVSVRRGQTTGVHFILKRL